MTTKQVETDYSQWGEQWLILDALSKIGYVQTTPRFLDLGAFDGMTGSNTRALSDQGWAGVLVEADPRAFIRLLGNHSGNDKMQCVLGAVAGREETSRGDRIGKNRIHVGSVQRVRPFYDAGDQVSTAFSGHQLGKLVKRSWWTGIITPWEIAKVFGSRFEFISIDVEGCDLDVIRALTPCLTHTRVVCYEDSLPNTDFDLTYYESLRRAWEEHGFTEVIGRTTNRSNGEPANTILCRNQAAPGGTLTRQIKRRSGVKPNVKQSSIDALKKHSWRWKVPQKEVNEPAMVEAKATTVADHSSDQGSQPPDSGGVAS